jgi:hypothetical protein
MGAVSQVRQPPSKARPVAYMPDVVAPHGEIEIVGVMEAGRFKVMINMSSDHAGIAAELNKFERELYGVIAHVDDARKLRDYLQAMVVWSQTWCASNGIDMRSWTDNARYRRT